MELARQRGHPHAAGHGPEALQAGAQLLGREAEQSPDRCGGERVVHHDAAEGFQADPHGRGAKQEVELEPGRGLRDGGGAHPGRLGATEQQGIPAETRGHGGHARVVRVQNRAPARGEPRHERALFGGHPLERAQPLQVGRADVGDDRDVRPADFGQARDLSRQAGAELEYGPLVARFETEEGQRDADLVVEVARGLQDRETARQDGGRHAARARLAVGAGDRHDRGRAAAPMAGRDVPERAGRVGHRDAGGLRAGAERRAESFQPVRGHHNPAGRPVGKYLRQEAVTVVRLAVDGDEGLARRDRARVDRQAREGGLGSALNQPPAGRLEDVLKGALHAPPLSYAVSPGAPGAGAASTRAASSRSSKWTVRPPMLW